jgi:CRISPR-associated Csx14 family protein
MWGQAGTLIATLGTKPQVVTTAADLLSREGYALGDVVVLHTTVPGGVIAGAVDRLRQEFASHPAYQALQLHLQPIPGLADVTSQAEAETAFRAMYQAVLAAKRAGQTVHLSIVGGRKVFAVYGMAAAQLLFDDDDCLWYVLVGGKFWADERLHPAPGDEARLVRVPVLRWGAISPVLTDLSQVDDPFEAAERQRALRLREQLDEARAFVLGSLSGAEQRVVELLVREGLSDNDIGQRLSLSPRTVEHHLREAYRKAAARWELPGVNRTQLVTLLNLYYRVRGETSPKP